ncbi:MAG: hypothetical protein II363_04895 [Clostridia bacterium]|nr:hypothetical protein [Clostridia bacterium]
MKKSMVRLISVLCVLVFLLTAIPVSAESLSSTTDSTASVISSERVSSNLPDDADIVGEIESLRDANTKFFRRTDGLLVAAIYNNPIHYHDGYHWKEINNTLISAEVKNGVAYYKNTANSLLS